MKKTKFYCYRQFYFFTFTLYISIISYGFSGFYSIFHEDGPYPHAFQRDWRISTKFQNNHDVLVFTLSFEKKGDSPEKQAQYDQDYLSFPNASLVHYHESLSLSMDFFIEKMNASQDQDENGKKRRSDFFEYTPEKSIDLHRCFVTHFGYMTISLKNDSTLSADMKRIRDYHHLDDLTNYLALWIEDEVRQKNRQEENRQIAQTQAEEKKQYFFYN